MARTPRSSGSSRSSRSSGGGGSRRTSTRPRTEEREERSSLFGIPLIKFGDITPLIQGPFSYALSQTPWGPTRGAGNVLGALASSPYYMTRYPKSTLGDAWETVRGIYELPPALRRSVHEQGWQQTGAMMLAGMAEDYKRRYGKNWREEAKKDPFFNFLDATAFLGAATKTLALSKAASELSKAGVARTALEFKAPRLTSPLPFRGGTVVQEMKRPGLLSKGEAETRKLTAPSGDTIEQPYSRSPLRRDMQNLADEMAMRYPNMPMMGASTRVARGVSRQLTRETERLMGSVSDPHAVEALPEALQTRLYWGAQIGDHTSEGLREFRNLLSDALEKGELPDDPEFRSVVMEARRRGFGKQLIRRLDKAIDAKPDARYDRAIESMQDMTRVTEETIKDANGFAGHTGDLKRASDRLRGLSRSVWRQARDLPEDGSGWDAFVESIPDDVLRQAVHDYLKPRAALRDIGALLEDMFGSRRNRVRDWKDAQLLARIPERMERFEQFKQLWGEDKARAVLAAYDAAARASGDAADFWKNKVGAPNAETAADLAGRDAFFQRRQILQAIGQEPEGVGVFRTVEPSPFYSPVQKWVNESMPNRVQAKQLPGILAKQGRKEELKETGIIDWIKSKDPESYIAKEEVQEYLSNPANAYNLEEIHFSSLSQNYSPRWQYLSGLSAVTNPNADYHQIIFRIPERYGKGPTYLGKGKGHWDESNVVAHIRFHVFTDKKTGLKTMVVEEAQSDWLSQWLKAKKSQTGLTPEQAEFARRSREMQAIGEQAADMEDDVLDHLRGRIDDATDANERRAAQEEYDAAWREWDELNAKGQQMEDELFADLDKAGYDEDQAWEWAQIEETPEAPLTEEMLFSISAKRIARFAADNEIEQIVVPTGDVHRVRYKQFDPKQVELYAGPGTLPGDVEPSAVSVTRALAGETSTHNAPTNMFKRYYDPGRGLNKALASELGKSGHYDEKAFRGRHALEATDQGRSAQGNMPGSVYNLGADDWAKHAKRPKAFKQQSEWDELPRGAMELLADGRRHIHLFETADPSTAIHELGHTALYDLPESERAVVEGILAGGRKLDDWVESDHETFARAFEAYIRRGQAPVPELRDVFAKLGEWLREIWQAAKQDPDANLNPEVVKVFDGLFTRHRPDDVDTFIPHRAADPNLSGGRVSRGVPRATQDIGDEAMSRVPLFARNKLALMGMGLINDDPKLLIEHMNRIVMLARANQLRETVLEMGRPLMPDEIPDFKNQYVVKKAGRGVNRPLYEAMEAADDPAEIRDNIKGFVDAYITDERAKWEDWRGKDQLYVVDKDYVDKLFKNVTGKTPGATTKGESSWTKAADAGLDTVRSMLLYLNPGFYTANLLGNATMMGLSDPRAMRFVIPSFKQAMKAAYKPDTADPLWRRIGVEMGRGPTSGGLSTRPALVGRQASRRGPVAGRVAENVSLGIGEYGRRSGRVIDDAMRVAVWKQTAHKFGYTTDAKIRKLLEDGTGRSATKKAKRDLAGIRDEAEQLMLDFDSMTPFEKSWLTRVIFLYPFLKASAKWPAMFLGERPITAGVAGALAGEGSRMTTEQLGERPPLPLWMEGAARTGTGRYISAGQLSPTAPFFGLLESLLGVGGTPETGISRPIDYANPLYQLAVELAQGRSQFGQEMSAPSILRQDFPMTALQRQALQLKQPSDIYTDRDILHTFLRSLRFLPYGVNEPPTPVRPPEPGTTTSRRTRG